jgi:ankyrin repeat protein
MASFGLGGGGGGGSANSGVAAVVASVPQPNLDASTPYLAASEGNVSLLQSSLQQLGQPLTIQDDNQYTLLHAAASYGQISVLQFLLSSSQKEELPADDEYWNAADQDGDTALHYACNVETAKWLWESGKCRIQANAYGKTPLQSKQDELQELLLQDDDEEDDVETLKALIDYLSTISPSSSSS